MVAVFDRLMEMIPANVYVAKENPTDQWVHGMSKKARAKSKKKTKLNLKKAKRARDYTAKLSDFGLAKDGPEGDKTHVSTRIMGTYGYAAPEYVMIGTHHREDCREVGCATP